MNFLSMPNAERQNELDIARGLAVIFMVLIHCVEYFYNGEDSVFFKVANFLGSPPAAPVFMFILGCGIVYSRRSAPGLLFRRGVIFLVLSYVFNALVYVLPYYISAKLNDDAEIFEENWTQIYDADILQFAGLAFIFFALMKKLNLPNLGYLIVGIICSGAAMYLGENFAEFESTCLQAITGLFWGTHEGSYFPFLSWIAYPIAGYLFADILIYTCPEDKGSLYTKLSVIAGIIFIASAVVLAKFYAWDDMMDGDPYYHQNIFFNIMFIAFVLAWIGLMYLVAKVLPNLIMSCLKTISVLVTPFYVLQYIFIIYIAVLVFGDEAEWEMGPTLLMFVAVTILSYIVAVIYSKIRRS